MDMKVIEMLNNYPDGYNPDNNDSSILGKYCVLGYYDGMDVKLSFDNHNDDMLAGWKCKDSAVVPRLEGKGKITSLCVQLKDSDKAKTNKNLRIKEEKLWDDDNALPFLIVSMIRTKTNSDLSGFVRVINERDEMIAYYSYEHCELVVVFRCGAYSEVLSTVRCFYESGIVLKIYSILGISEKLLEKPDELKKKVKSENINVRMNIAMRSRRLMGDFFRSLEEVLEKGAAPNAYSVGKYDLLGDDDFLVEINDIPIDVMLPLYAKGGLLNHENELYRNAFYNVETRFLSQEDMTFATDTSETIRCKHDTDEDEKRKHKELYQKAIWIRKKIDTLRKMYDGEDLKHENALLSYISCMIRLLNSMVQIATSDFYRYERAILMDPLRIFVDYFIEQINEIRRLDKDEVSQKISLIEDVEEAVCRVSDIYENVLNGTANTDKQMFLSFPLNSSIYELSPKLYAYYSDIMKDILDIFDHEHYYAFFLNPTLKRKLQEEVLFDSRQEKGKVIIIDIPVRMLDDVTYLPVFMIHEMFHVITSDERNRKFRARLLFACVLLNLKESIFSGVKFFDDDNDIKLKEALNERWFKESSSYFDDMLVNEKETSKEFYGKKFSEWLNDILEKDLLKIEKDVTDDILDEIMKDKERYSKSIFEFNAFDKNYRRMIEQVKIIDHNVKDVLHSKYVEYCITNLMYFFRECYADIAMLLVTGFDLQRYRKAFLTSAQFDVYESVFNADDYHIMRNSLVEIVASYEETEVIRGNKLTEIGLMYYCNMTGQIIKSQKKEENYSPKAFCSNPVHKDSVQISRAKMIVNEDVYFCLLNYLFLCKQDLNERMSHLDEHDMEKLNRVRVSLEVEASDIIGGYQSSRQEI